MSAQEIYFLTLVLIHEMFIFYNIYEKQKELFAIFQWNELIII